MSTWIPLEYELNLTYGDEEANYNPKLEKLRGEIRDITLRIINENIERK